MTPPLTNNPLPSPQTQDVSSPALLPARGLSSLPQAQCAEGNTSDIPLQVGIKQGCPLSPLLFNIALEALLPALDSNNSGYTFTNGSIIRQLVFADDLCVLSECKEELQDCLRVLKEFSDWSGFYGQNNEGAEKK